MCIIYNKCADVDVTYVQQAKTKRAGEYLFNFDTDKNYYRVINALALLGFNLTPAQETNFRERWLQVSLL